MLAEAWFGDQEGSAAILPPSSLHVCVAGGPQSSLALESRHAPTGQQRPHPICCIGDNTAAPSFRVSRRVGKGHC